MYICMYVYVYICRYVHKYVYTPSLFPGLSVHMVMRDVAGGPPGTACYDRRRSKLQPSLAKDACQPLGSASQSF